ncbi:MAG: Abi family protein [Chloroflexota bacterium]|nr:MAG: Abi family protein [Chloroflexota bacterium]
MKYTKPAISFEQQAQRLLDRGLIAPNKEALIQHLSMVNYYRLSAYWYPYKRIDSTGNECFAPDTTFETIWRRYTFDHHLRLLVMDAIEHVEITILRTRIVEQFTLLHGPFGYCDPGNFHPKFDHVRLMQETDNAVERSKEEFVQRFQRKYTSEPHLPLWMTAEVMTFGQLFTFFRFLHNVEKKQIAQMLNVHLPVLESWLHTLLFIRNVCAHHSRLWNRAIPIRPKLPIARHSPEWHKPVKISNRRVFVVLTVLKYLLSHISPQTDWNDRLFSLLDEYHDIPLREMGFPENWRGSSLWK